MADASSANPATAPSFLGTLAPGVHVVGGMGNALSVETEEGVLQLDTGVSAKQATKMIARLREISDAPVFAIAYSHGHLGYNNAVETWLEDAERRGDPPPRVIAHENLVRRWQRYRETEGLQNFFVELQFRVPRGQVDQPIKTRMPDETFRETLTLSAGARTVQLLWAPSETDDAIVLWMPEEKLLYGGAAVTPSIPNVGTPLRSLRDPVRWADTLDRLAALDAELLVMEFGPAIEGRERIQKILTKTSTALRWLRTNVVERLNRGMGVVEILHDLDYPADLFDQPWMRPIYGDPDYIVRDIVRAETGWWDRNPTNLHPSHPDEAGAAVLSAITDRKAVLDRARALADEGKVQLALHVVDVLALAPGDDPDLVAARALKAELCRMLADDAHSFVSQSLYVSSARLIDEGSPLPTGVR
ncbi:MAG: MBL fold metallo-hydrolase [Deltaproteobacteria bacterium]|nr:MBL fold metallo-hydrolase [Deltaproteobacteria bacterium]